MLYTIIAIVLILHGLIHLIGFAVNWQLVTLADIPYSTSVLVGKVYVGAAGIRVVGIFWLIVTVGFVVAGIGLLILAPWWYALTFWMALFSLVLCILAWPEAQFGAYTNLIILAFLLVGEQLGWLPQI